MSDNSGRNKCQKIARSFSDIHWHTGYHINNFVYKFKIVCMKVHFNVVDTRSSTLFLSSTSYIPGDVIKERLLHVWNIWPSGVVLSYTYSLNISCTSFFSTSDFIESTCSKFFHLFDRKGLILDNHARRDTCFDEYTVSTASWINSLAIR